MLVVDIRNLLSSWKDIEIIDGIKTTLWRPISIYYLVWYWYCKLASVDSILECFLLRTLSEGDILHSCESYRRLFTTRRDFISAFADDGYIFWLRGESPLNRQGFGVTSLAFATTWWQYFPVSQWLSLTMGDSLRFNGNIFILYSYFFGSARDFCLRGESVRLDATLFRLLWLTATFSGFAVTFSASATASWWLSPPPSLGLIWSLNIGLESERDNKMMWKVGLLIKNALFNWTEKWTYTSDRYFPVSEKLHKRLQLDSWSQWITSKTSF